MSGINLIPAHRIRQRQAVTRVRRWAMVAPGCGALLLAAILINAASWDTNTATAAAALSEVEQKIKEADASIVRQKRELREQQAVLRANRAVGEQPDWGLLLALLASRLGDDAVLSGCSVEPAAPDPGAKAPIKSEAGRPSKLRLTIKGQSRTQEAASRFVIDLERTGVFDRVTLVETKRSEPPFEDVSFEVLCALSDSGAMSK